MKKLRINVFETDTLANILETPAEARQGFSVKDLRQLNTILDELEEGYKEFRNKKEEILKRYENESDLQKRNRLIQEDFDMLKEKAKQEDDEYEFENADWSFLFERWGKAQFQGFREAREIALSLDEKINKANNTSNQKDADTE